MRDMSWEEKLLCLQGLGETSLRMREPGNWYVDARRRDCIRGIFAVGAYGNGNTPQAAVEADWAIISKEPCVRAGDAHYTWNGSMWDRLTDSEVATRRELHPEVAENKRAAAAYVAQKKP